MRKIAKILPILLIGSLFIGCSSDKTISNDIINENEETTKSQSYSYNDKDFKTIFEDYNLDLYYDEAITSNDFLDSNGESLCMDNDSLWALSIINYNLGNTLLQRGHVLDEEEIMAYFNISRNEYTDFAAIIDDENLNICVVGKASNGDATEMKDKIYSYVDKLVEGMGENVNQLAKYVSIEVTSSVDYVFCVLEVDDLKDFSGYSLNELEKYYKEENSKNILAIRNVLIYQWKRDAEQDYTINLRDHNGNKIVTLENEDEDGNEYIDEETPQTIEEPIVEEVVEETTEEIPIENETIEVSSNTVIEPIEPSENLD